MKTYDLVELAARNLRESVLRNSLTTLGIGVGVASLVAMLSLGVGLQQMANQRLEKSGLFDTVVVSSRRDYRGGNRPRTDEGPPPAESRALDEEARAEIERLPNVLEAIPDLRFITELRYEGKPHLAMVAGMPMSARQRDAFESMQGGFFSSEDAAEAVLVKEFAEELLGISRHPGATGASGGAWAAPLIGKELTLRYAERAAGSETPESNFSGAKRGAATRDPAAARDSGDLKPSPAFSVVPRERILRIVGVTDQDPEAMRGQSHAGVFIPLRFSEHLHVLLPSDLRESAASLESRPIYSTLSVRVKNPNQVESVQQAIKKMGYNTFSILDAARGLRRFFTVLDLFLGIFGSLALAVASLGIVNTLVMAILERRREIGIMKAVGASDGDVKKLFFTEAGAMGAFGGAAGVVLGWAIGKAINFGTNMYLRAHELPSERIWFVPWWLAAGAVTFAVIISMASGLYPAARAARLDPVEALRHE